MTILTAYTTDRQLDVASPLLGLALRLPPGHRRSWS